MIGNMKKAITLGLMSGTSVDGIDASLVLHQGDQDHLLLHLQEPYPKKLREEILELIRTPSMSLENFTRLHYEIGEAFAHTALKTIKAAKNKKFLTAKMPLLAIGAHGQTVFHQPEHKRTLQIGEGSIIAVRTGVTTVSDFRVADTAAGGEGAPLLPFYHRRLFAKEAKSGLLVHNLGGISNYTYLGPKGQIFALDTGPANCLLDGAIQKLSNGETSFDQDGALARDGRLSAELLQWLEQNPEIAAFRKKAAPKSTGRELFSPRLLEKAMADFSHLYPEDLMRTLAQFTVDLIAESYERDIFKKRLPLKTAVLAGGGAKNSFLTQLLHLRFPKVNFLTMEDFGFNSQALESQAFGAFALLALQGKAITRANTTGVKQEVICGKISPGANWP
jgi:anhydro-N-acetylmuramic acid kinase